MIFMKTTLNMYYLQNISYRKHCPCSGNRSFLYSVVPSPTGQREKKAMTDLEYGYTQEANIRGGGKNQRHIIRYRRPGTTVCPGCWAMGTHKVKEVRIKMFCTGLTRAAEAAKKIYFTGTMSQIHQPSKDPFLLYFISLHLPQFQQSNSGRPSLVSLVQKRHGSFALAIVPESRFGIQIICELNFI